MTPIPLVALAVGLLAAPDGTADLSKLDRTIKREPAYKHAPQYALLVFGPQARDRVWLVRDGGTLYVDRNGDGDLTGPGEKVPARKLAARDPATAGYLFEVGELTVGGKVHKGLDVDLSPVRRFADNPSLAAVPVIRAALKARPEALAARIVVDVESARFKGAGVGGRINQMAGPFDLTGVLCFADSPAAAPVIHFDGPLQATFYGEVPTLRLRRDNDLVLTVGTPGLGGGTFAMLGYQDTMPTAAYPTVEVRWPGEPPVRELFELKERC